jgi:hypothetical protein
VVRGRCRSKSDQDRIYTVISRLEAGFETR